MTRLAQQPFLAKADDILLNIARFTLYNCPRSIEAVIEVQCDFTTMPQVRYFKFYKGYNIEEYLRGDGIFSTLCKHNYMFDRQTYICIIWLIVQKNHVDNRK